MIRRADLIDVPERRSVSSEHFEFRAKGDTLRFTGYASVFDKGYDVHGGPAGGGWTEYVTRKAFDTTLRANPDVHLLINHDGLPLARTKSGTLRLAVDSTGLHSEADLDLRDPAVRSLAVKMERGDVDEMSFAFRVKAQTWSDDESQRYLNEVSLHKGDVSIVSFGANPYTSATLRSAFRAIANGELGERELAELRAMNEVGRAVAIIGGRRKEGQEDESRDLAPNIIVGNKSAFAQQIHDMALNSGANCDPTDADIVAGGGDDGELTPMRAMSPMATDSLEAGDAMDIGELPDSALAQAVHDLCVDAGADCANMTEPEDGPMYEPEQNSLKESTPDSRSPLSIADAEQLTLSKGNLSITDAARMLRPDDAPEPLSLEDAERIAS